MQNSKSKAPNPKQIQNSKLQIKNLLLPCHAELACPPLEGFGISILEILKQVQDDKY
jgi:hypothetical protein